MANVQFYGIDKVIEAFDSRGCFAYFLLVGKQPLTSYAGNSVNDASENLEKFLTMIDDRTKAIYTLRYYESVDGKITEKTPYDGSFNFMFSRTQAGDGEGYRSSALMERLGAIEAKLAAPDEKQNTIGVIADYIENNEWAQKLLMQMAGHYLKLPGLLQTMQPQMLGNVTPAGNLDLQQIIAVLQQKDPKLTEHLGKIAALPDQQLQLLLMYVDQM